MNDLPIIFAFVFILGLLLGVVIGNKEQTSLHLQSLKLIMDRLRPESLLDIQRVELDLATEALESRIKGKFLALLTLSVIILGGCGPGNDRAMRVLKSAGYTSVHLGVYPFYACGDDNFNVEFTGFGPTGEVVSGAVCCGLLKNCTIRVD